MRPEFKFLNNFVAMLSARKMRKRKLTLPSVRHVKKLSGREEVGHGSVNRQQSSGVQEDKEEEASNESTQGSNLPKLENEKDSVLLELMQHGFEKLLAKRGIEALGSHSTFEEVMVYLISLEEVDCINAIYNSIYFKYRNIARKRNIMLNMIVRRLRAKEKKKLFR